MKFTARWIVKGWIKSKVNLPNVELALGIPQGSLKEAAINEGPVHAELEILLSMVARFPWLLRAAQDNFDLNNTVKRLFVEWKDSQEKISSLLSTETV